MNTKISGTSVHKSPILCVFLTIFISLTLISCSSTNHNANETEQKAFCYKGGKTNDYSCDVEAQVEDTDIRTPDIDEDWMYETLGEIKKWLHEEKKILESSTTTKNDAK